MNRSTVALYLVWTITGCRRGEPPAVQAPMTVALTSSAFQPNGAIPAKYTCEGESVSPPLTWSALPQGTRSVAIVLEDPDAPDPAKRQRTWVHWVVYDLPPGGSLAENARQLPAGALGGANDWKKTEYGGPCPPVGQHRYVHHIYALDEVLPDLHGPAKADLLRAMEGHVLAQGELVGTYQKTH
jgi:Raf kinase inhibitor-like YbhB/YbcL family protein